MKCGECLMDDTMMVELLPSGICPRCGTDYRDFILTTPVASELEAVGLPVVILDQPINPPEDE